MPPRLPRCTGLLALLLLLAAPAIRAQQADTAAAPPNILIFIADDAGWDDFGAYGNEAIQTPSVDRLAESGLKVERAFLTIAQCSPSRISILTGRYPHATGAEDLHMPLPDSLRILPSALQEAGYFTGHMKKTHYGEHANAQFQWYSPDLSESFPDFLDEADGRPFFLWVGFSDPHRPYGDAPAVHDAADVRVPPQLADTPETRGDLARYYDEIARMDGHIGRMLDTLEARGRRENTLVVFLSDNGMPFPRAKGTAYDAGIRTPLIFSWPAVIDSGAVYDDGLVSVVDLAPTLLELAGAEPLDGMQGERVRTLLEEPSAYAGRERIFAERNWHDCDEHIRAVRTERYKLIRNEAYQALPLCTAADLASSPSWYSLLQLKEEDALTAEQARLFEAPRARVELYDLEEDPGEFHNLAGDPAHADVLRELVGALETWMEETGDFPPTVRLRDDHTDRVTGARFSDEMPPMYDLASDER